MRNTKLISVLTVFLGLFIVNVNAQFDDLYFDEGDFSSERDYVYEDVDSEVAQYDNAIVDEYDGDDFDEYTTYYTNDYDIDGYQYTNRLEQYRLARIASSYYGANFLGCGTSSSFFRRFNRQVSNDRFFANYVRNQLLFNPGTSRLAFSGGFNSFGPFGGVGGRTFNRWNGFNSFSSFAFGFPGDFRGGRFVINSIGGGYGCPAYGFTAINSTRFANASNSIANVSRVNSSRSTSSITRSNSGTRSTNASKSNVRSTSARGVSTSSTRTRVSAAPSTRTVRASGNSRTVTRSSPSSSSRISSSSRSSRSSSLAPRSSSRSSSVGSSRSSRSSSSSARSSSSSSRSSSSSVRSSRRP